MSFYDFFMKTMTRAENNLMINKGVKTLSFCHQITSNKPMINLFFVLYLLFKRHIIPTE